MLKDGGTLQMLTAPQMAQMTMKTVTTLMHPVEQKVKARSASDHQKAIVSVMWNCMYVCSPGCLLSTLIHTCRLKLLPKNQTKSKYGKRAHMMMPKMALWPGPCVFDVWLITIYEHWAELPLSSCEVC
jgi:hypothetical protein